jgi:hypothetical protein
LLAFALLAAACALALWPEPAHALELRWTAPAACPSQEDVQARIDGLLRAPGKPASSAEQGAHASAKLSALRSGFKLVLTLSGDGLGGTRTLTGKDCAELAETAAFLIAVAIDPSLPGTEPPVVEPPPAETPLVPPPPPPVPPPPPPPPAPRMVERARPFSLQASTFGGAWSAGLPRTQGQLGASVGVALRRLQLELRGSYAFEEGKEGLGRDDLQGGDVPGVLYVSSSGFELAACHLWGARVFGGPCGSLTLVRTHAKAEDFEKNPGGNLLWMSASIAGQVGIRVNRWLEPFIEGGVGGPISKRPSFRVQGSEQQLDGDRYLFYARLGVRFRWQPTRSAVAP